MSDQPWIKTNLIAKISIGVAIATLITPPAFYIRNFWGHPLSQSPSDWGVFGDYVGGVLNPIIGLLTLIATVFLAFIVYRYQRSHEGEEEALKTACELLKEWNSTDMLRHRYSAENVFSNTTEDLHNIPFDPKRDEDATDVLAVIGFFVRLEKLISHGAIRIEHATDIFSKAFIHWHVRYFDGRVIDAFHSRESIKALEARFRNCLSVAKYVEYADLVRSGQSIAL